jgi:hypothetical protein
MTSPTVPGKYEVVLVLLRVQVPGTVNIQVPGTGHDRTGQCDDPQAEK